jgi:hypothetical protein
MRLQPMSPPDLLRAADRDPDRLGHGAGAPVRRVRRPFGRRLGHDLPHRRLRQRLLARWPRLVAQQAVNPGFGEPSLPAPHRRLRLPGPLHDLHGARAPSAARSGLGEHAFAAYSDPLSLCTANPILRRKLDGNPRSHRPRFAQIVLPGNPLFRSEHKAPIWRFHHMIPKLTEPETDVSIRRPVLKS